MNEQKSDRGESELLFVRCVVSYWNLATSRTRASFRNWAVSLTLGPARNRRDFSRGLPFSGWSFAVGRGSFGAASQVFRFDGTRKSPISMQLGERAK